MGLHALIVKQYKDLCIFIVHWVRDIVLSDLRGVHAGHCIILTVDVNIILDKGVPIFSCFGVIVPFAPVLQQFRSYFPLFLRVFCHLTPCCSFSHSPFPSLLILPPLLPPAPFYIPYFPIFFIHPILLIRSIPSSFRRCLTIYFPQGLDTNLFKYEVLHL